LRDASARAVHADARRTLAIYTPFFTPRRHCHAADIAMLRVAAIATLRLPTVTV